VTTQAIASIADLDQLPVGCAVMELDGRVVAVNARAAALLGRPADELRGGFAWEVAPALEALWPRVVADLREYREHADTIAIATARGTRTFEYVVAARRFDGRTVALALAIPTSGRDAAGDSRQRLESLGLVAGGVAHDFNNQLVSVLAEASVAREDPGLPEPVRDSLVRIEAAAKRMAQLTRQLLAYAGRGRFVTELMDPDDLVADARAQLERTLHEGVALELATAAPGAIAIEADRSLLRQVVFNLVANANEAVEVAVGRITVTSSTVAYGGRTWWELVVADNGAGMDERTRARVFDPFFTTKPDRHGLGLSAVHGIVRRLGGEVAIESRLGDGTRVRVLLPVVPGARPARRHSTTEQTLPRVLAGTHVLLADDEPTVRSTVRRLLERRGAVVTAAADGREAEAQLRAGSFGLVVLDVIMPVKNGYELLAIARETQPTAGVMLMSGFTDASRDTGGDEPDAFLEKPFTAKVLDDALDDVLRGRER
jgi:signal transduction histidine kinase